MSCPSPPPLPSSPTSPKHPRAHYILDAHTHLWPASIANSTAHTWMTPNHPLARPYVLDDYAAAVEFPASKLGENDTATASTKPKHLGVVYVETDRTILPASRAVFIEEEEGKELLGRYTHPLDELSLLRSFVTSDKHGSLIRAIVAFAPVDLGPRGLERYVIRAREVAGEKIWRRVVGFRFLVQGLRDQREFEAVVGGEMWVRGLKWLGREGRTWRWQGDCREEVEGIEEMDTQKAGGRRKRRRGFTFDVGIDQRQGGDFQLEGFAECVERVRMLEDEDEGDGESDDEDGETARTTFILNHFLKPSFSPISSPSFKTWHAALSRFAAQPAVYLKLSGFLTELSSPITSSSTSSSSSIDPSSISASTNQTSNSNATFNLIVPYVRAAFELFGVRRIMYGSDWPVCNVGLGGSGNDGGQGHWREWLDVVESLLDEVGVGEEEREWVWWKTAVEAYGVKIDLDGKRLEV